MRISRRGLLRTAGVTAMQCALAVQARAESHVYLPMLGSSRVLRPWRTISLHPDYAGCWLIGGDIDGDGQAEIVYARNRKKWIGTAEVWDYQFVTSVCAQKLDGTVLWNWGNPSDGQPGIGYDLGCQIHDWDGDGNYEVIILTEDELVELDAATGIERRRLPLPPFATDCIVFADLSGKGRPSDILIKTRYTQIWAYDYDWELLWTVHRPGGYLTAHQPVPMDIDMDGRDEIMAGFALLDHDGTILWTYTSDNLNLSNGHLDCARVLRRGSAPEDWRLVLSFCGAEGLAMVDGHGDQIWEITGHHFQSIGIGDVRSDVAGLEIVVDIDKHPWGSSPLWILDESGQQLVEIITDCSRLHHLVDWRGLGCKDLVIGLARGLWDGRGRQLVRCNLVLPKGIRDPDGALVKLGDMTGDGRQEILFHTQNAAYVFYSDSSIRSKGVPIGTGINVTLY